MVEDTMPADAERRNTVDGYLVDAAQVKRETAHGLEPGQGSARISAARTRVPDVLDRPQHPEDQAAAREVPRGVEDDEGARVGRGVVVEVEGHRAARKGGRGPVFVYPPEVPANAVASVDEWKSVSRQRR